MFFGEVTDSKDISENTREGKEKFDLVALEKFDSLMEDDELPESETDDIADSWEDGDKLFDEMFADDFEDDDGLSDYSDYDSDENFAKSVNDVNDSENSEAIDGKNIENKKDGLTDEEKKELKERIDWPDEIIDSISSIEEAEIYEKAGLQPVDIDGKLCLIRSDIDLDQVDEDGISNRERMERGRPPITKDGKEVELHHIGQKQDSPLAELTMEEHRGTGNDTILHDKTKESEIDRTAFAKERKEHWKSRAIY